MDAVDTTKTEAQSSALPRNLILVATCGLFIFSLLKGIRLASRLIDTIDRRRTRA